MRLHDSVNRNVIEPVFKEVVWFTAKHEPMLRMIFLPHNHFPNHATWPEMGRYYSSFN
jgi:hypothetical protein